MMEIAAIEAYLHRHIPLSAAMGIRVLSSDADGVRLGAALTPNLNHQSTAFGGSVSCIAILAAWTLTHAGLRERGVEAGVVIQRSTTEYRAPITADFEAFCPAPSAAEWERFVSAVHKRGRGRLRLHAHVTSGGVLAAEFHGMYVALA